MQKYGIEENAANAIIILIIINTLLFLSTGYNKDIIFNTNPHVITIKKTNNLSSSLFLFNDIIFDSPKQDLKFFFRSCLFLIISSKL